jgi:sugar phosphate permease
MLIGLAGAELVAPGAVGASQGILGWIAYLGAANAGIPLSHVVQVRKGCSGFRARMHPHGWARNSVIVVRHPAGQGRVVGTELHWAGRRVP